jgi:hypothetical protein
MAKDNQINIRVNDAMDEAIEEYREDRDFTKPEACRRMLESRLVADGYLEGVVRSDGGELVDEIEATQNGIETTQSQIEATQSEVSELKSEFHQLVPVFLIALFWIGIESAVGIPFGSAGTISSGMAVMAIVLYRYYEVYISG